MRRPPLILSVILVLVIATGAVLLVGGLRWRAQLAGLKALGKLPDVGWLELGGMLGSHGTFYLKPMVESRNPHSTIFIPDNSPAALTAGRELYRASCASCHGARGEGATGPALVGRSFDHGDSDWALYRAMKRGIAGTPMRPVPIADAERWKVAAFVRLLQRGRDSAATGERLATARLRPVGAQDLRVARSDSANWLTYSGAYDGWRYATLGQIDRRNAGRLSLRWIYQLTEPEEKIETTPLVADGLLFLSTPRGGIKALDAATGELLWSYDRTLSGEVQACCGVVNRGLALLDSTLYVATLDAHLIAVDARLGTVRWDVTVAAPDAGYSFTSAPLALKDLIVIGNAGGEFATRGFIDAYDARTGGRRWRFSTIPEPGAPGSESWSGASWKAGGAPAWLTGSYDPALDLIYWGVGNPNPDFNGDGRLGDNLYSNSVVALEAATGALKWHFQFTPHDQWDWDSAQIPILVDAPGQEPASLLLWANRNAFYYVLDRRTGRFVRGLAYSRQTWAEGLDAGGRPVLRGNVTPTRTGTFVFPSWIGATNWWPPTYSPHTGFFYVPTFERGVRFFKGFVPATSKGKRMGSSSQPPEAGSGRLVIRALEALTGAPRWEYQVLEGGGEYPPVGGLLSTSGDVVFAGGGERFLALDAENGKLLWSFPTGGRVMAAPITYLVNGHQRITVAAGRAILTFGIE
jgi:alcohol dehydrogenase (cytochrome c)